MFIFKKNSNAVEKMTANFEERFDRLIDRVQKSAKNLTDDLLNAVIQNKERFDKGTDRLIEQFKEISLKHSLKYEATNTKILDEFEARLTQSINAVKNIKSNFMRDIEKKTKRLMIPQFPEHLKPLDHIPKIEQPKFFLSDFIQNTKRYDFINHFLEFHFGARFRRNSHRRVFEWNGERYIPTSLEAVEKQIMVPELLESYRLVKKMNGKEQYLELFDWFVNGEMMLDTKAIDKFLLYMHNLLPKMRN